MDNSGNDPLVALICFAPFACTILLVFGGGMALMLWYIRRKWQPKTPAVLAKERKEMESQVGKLKESLRPWSSGSLSDLSTDWKASWTTWVRDLSAHGTIPTVSDPKGPPLVAFDIRERGQLSLNAHMVAVTAEQSFYFRIAQKSIDIELDGTPFGKVQADGTLVDAQNTPIGSAVRPGGVPFILSLGTLSKRFDARERTFPVNLHGRIVAHLGNPPVQMLNALSPKKREYAPAVELEGFPTDHEETWLLALAIVQVAGFNLLESVWIRPKTMTGVP